MRYLIMLVLAAVLGSCAALSPAQFSLAGMRWQLASIQSMDDAQGTTRPDDPSRYTVAFGADGRAAFRLDCNRASAEWSVIAAGADTRSGQLSFGVLAGTRAMCAAGSLDRRLSQQLPYVRGYLVRDGQLHLSLFADGGILSWAPVK
jgi:heat shock protein HslJ